MWISTFEILFSYVLCFMNNGRTYNQIWASSIIFNKLFSFIATLCFFLNSMYVPEMSPWLLIYKLFFISLKLDFSFSLLLLTEIWFTTQFSFEKVEQIHKIQISFFLKIFTKWNVTYIATTYGSVYLYPQERKDLLNKQKLKKKIIVIL